jgi:AcrR family transcriptional regulator
MGIKERRLREKESLRQEILDAARELFVEEGFESVSMRRIAEKIEYSPTTIYLHFKDKAELLHSICDETFKMLIVRLQRIQGEHTDPLESLKAGLREYCRFGLEFPQHYRVTFMGFGDRNDPGRYDDLNSSGAQAFAFLCQGIAACVGAGKLPSGDVQAYGQVLWSGAHGVTSLLIAKCAFPFIERNKLIDLVVDTLVDGLRA